jgi:hypothetical protein
MTMIRRFRDLEAFAAEVRGTQARDLAARAERAGFPDIAAQAREVGLANDELAQHHAQHAEEEDDS